MQWLCAEVEAAPNPNPNPNLNPNANPNPNPNPNPNANPNPKANPDQVEAALQRRVASEARWRPLLLVFSPEAEPGEGEHKLMRLVRLHAAAARPPAARGRVAVFGQDADLLLLALLQSHALDCYVVREAELPLQED